MGRKISRTQIELAEDEIDRIASRYHAWRGTLDGADYADEPGFCRSATLEEIGAAGFALSPGRFVGAPDAEEDAIVPLDHQLLTADEAAELLRLPVSTIYDLARMGRLPHLKIGRVLRFSRGDLEAHLAERCRAPITARV